MRYLVSVEDSIKDILQTPLHTRVMRPEYGSRLLELMDRRVDEAWLSDAALFCSEAITRWESRVKLKSVKVNNMGKSNPTLVLSFYDYKDVEVAL